MSSRAFIWVVVVTGFILLIPLIAMQFTSEVNWALLDFVVMGTLLLGTGSVFVLTVKRASRKYRGIIAMAFLLMFLYVWAEQAVGIFTDLGS